MEKKKFSDNKVLIKFNSNVRNGFLLPFYISINISIYSNHSNNNSADGIYIYILSIYIFLKNF